MLIDQTAILLFGRSQHGKSSLCNSIAKKQIAAVGKGDGESCTWNVQTIPSSPFGVLQEYPGYDDTRIRMDDPDFFEQSEADLVELGVKNVKFLLCESLADSTIQLREGVNKLIELHGDEVKASIVVVGTKLDRADEDELPMRLENVQSVMSKMGMGNNHFVQWKSKKYSFEDMEKQRSELRNAVDQVEAISTKNLVSLENRIRNRAKELCENQVPEKISRCENYMESEVIPYTETEEFIVYDTKEVQCGNMLDKDFENNAFLAGTAVALTMGIYAGARVSQPRFKTERVERKEKREVTKYKKIDVPKSRVVTAERKKPLEDFLLKARDDVIRDIRFGKKE